MKKEIIFIAQQLKSGGLEKAVITLANALIEKDDYNVSLYIVLHSEPIIPISKKINIQFLTDIQLKKESTIERYFRKIIELYAVRNIVKKIHGAIIISTRNEYSTIISKNTDKSNYIIAQLHNDYSPKELKDFCNKYNNINSFVQLNETFKDEIELAMRKKNNFTQVPVIPNFIEQQIYNDGPRMNYVIAVGGFNKVKGFDRLVEIWEIICKRENNNWTLLIAGDGREFNNINNLIKEKGLENKIKLLGRLTNEDVFKEMRKAKIYALSSYSEAFPFVALEAMQNKLPIIAFDVRTGPRNIIIDNETGFLVKDGELEEYADKLQLLMNNVELLQRMSNLAYQHSQDFLKDNIMKKWYELIDSADTIPPSTSVYKVL